MDDYGHDDSKSQPYLLCNYLEKLNDNKKSVPIRKVKQNVFICNESIVYQLVQFESNYNKKEESLFLKKTRFIEVLNCVQFTIFLFYLKICFIALRNTPQQ